MGEGGNPASSFNNQDRFNKQDLLCSFPNYVDFFC